MKCLCGEEMEWVESYGNNSTEPQEDRYRCRKCGNECWVDYCSISWKRDVAPSDEELKELKNRLYDNGEVNLSSYSCPENIKWDIEELCKKDKLKTRLDDTNTLVLVECWE